MMVLSLLSGCSSDSNTETTEATTAAATEATTEPAEEVVLKLGIWPEDTNPNEVALHESYAEIFKASHPGVELVPANYKYATDTFVSLAEAGNLPTIFETWFTEPQKLIKGAFVRDITSILEERGWLDDINPSIRQLLSDENGKVYGIPRDGYALGLMLNVELFEQAGLVNADGTVQYPKTWQEVAEMGKKIKDATGSAGLCILAKDNAGGWHFSNIAWNFGADLTLTGADGKFQANLASPEAIAAMEFVKSLRWEYDILTADPTNEDWGTGFVNLGTGAAAMYIGANDAVNQPTETNGLPVDKLALIPMPAGPSAQFSLSGGTPYMFAADATDAEVNAALDYLELMGKAPVVTDDSIAGMKADAEYRVGAGIPVIPRFPAWTNQELLDAEKAIIDEYSNINLALFNDYFTATKTEGNLKLEEEGATQDMYAELTKVLQSVLTDKNADVKSLMETANTNLQTILDNGLNK
jgi:ABC-type glycerol-3-phosphate transport system substrate-binding protein